MEKSWFGKFIFTALATTSAVLVMFLFAERFSTLIHDRYLPTISRSVLDPAIYWLIFAVVSLPVLFWTVRKIVRFIEDSNAKFVAATRQSIAGVYICQDERFKYVNPKFAQMFGYDEAEFLSGSITYKDIVDPMDWIKVEQSHRERFGGKGGTEHWEIRCRNNDGELLWVEIYDTLGTYLGKPALIGTAIDRTERKKDEEKNRKSEQDLIRVQKIAHIGFWNSDIEKNSLIWSDETYRICGLDKESVVLNFDTFLSCVHSDDKDLLLKIRQLAMTGRGDFKLEHRIVRPNGEIRHVYQEAEIEFRDGKPCQIFGVIHDITERKLMEKRLAYSEQEYRSLFDNNPDGVYSLDAAGRFLRVNPAGVAILGYSPEELVGTHFIPYVLVDDLPRTVESFKETLSGQSKNYELRAIHKSGRIVHLGLTTIPITVNNRIIGVHGIGKDITKQKKNDAFLRGQKRVLELIAKGENLQAVFDSIIDIAEFQLEGAVCSLFLYDKKSNELLFAAGQNMPESFVEQIQVIEVGPNNASCGASASRKETVIITDIENDDKFKKWCDIAIAHDLRSCWSIPIFGAGGSILGTFGVYYRSKRAPHYDEVELIKGISYLCGLAIERRQNEQYIEHLAYHDILTDLPNRRLFINRLTEVIEEANCKEKYVGLMYLDVDRFKQINDSFGHVYGDQFLKEVAHRLKNCVRVEDMVSRLGGDEFTVLLPNLTTERDAEEIASRIINVFRDPFAIDDNAIDVTTSIGIAIYPTHGKSVQDLIQCADTAMYAAKSRGKNTYQFYNSNMANTALQTLVLQSSMKAGLENKEFVLHYQPRVDAHTGKVVAVEALIRWQHPIRGIIPPGEFIPIAEETGFILDLGKWVIQEACQQNKSWQEAGHAAVRVAVNVSVRQFIDNSIVSTVREALQSTGLDAKFLEIEITESTLMKHEQTTLEILNGLQTMGVHISIDDFGTGYSSLSYLKQFNVNTLKIDKSFVSGIPHHADDVTIATSVIALAHALHLRVTAEGVETEEQLKFLRERKCDELQGFLLGQPVPSQDVVKTLRSGWNRLAGID